MTVVTGRSSSRLSAWDDMPPTVAVQLALSETLLAGATEERTEEGLALAQDVDGDDVAGRLINPAIDDKRGVVPGEKQGTGGRLRDPSKRAKLTNARGKIHAAAVAAVEMRGGQRRPGGKEWVVVGVYLYSGDKRPDAF